MMLGRTVYNGTLSQIDKIGKILSSIRQFEMQFGLVVAVVFKVATAPIKVFPHFFSFSLRSFPEALN